MKKLVYILICTLFLCYGCRDDDNSYPVYSVSVQLTYPENSEYNVEAGIAVKLTDRSGRAFDATTDANGKAVFAVPAGIYEASSSDKRSDEGVAYIYNGSTSNIVVTNSWKESEVCEVKFSESKAGQIIIKELYVGGCMDNNNTKNFHMDKYVILYNNTEVTANIDNLCLGMTVPLNSSGTNKDYENGNLLYEPEGWIPAGYGIWYLPGTLSIEPFKQVVIALTGAIDHTVTYSNSVNLGHSDYYCTYDPSVFTNTTYYPAPSELIPTSHYFSMLFYGAGTAWPLSNSSPAFYVFMPAKGITPQAFVNNTENIDYYGGSSSAANTRRKVPVDWILDGVEIFTTNNANNSKRLTPTVDGGYAMFTNQLGYTLYRNVDKEATEALEGNEALLVYGYDKGNTTTDPNNIDAEASLKNGARIVYADTNNSSNDFHQRSQASLKD